MSPFTIKNTSGGNYDIFLNGARIGYVARTCARGSMSSWGARATIAGKGYRAMGWDTRKRALEMLEQQAGL